MQKDSRSWKDILLENGEALDDPEEDAARNKAELYGRGKRQRKPLQPTPWQLDSPQKHRKSVGRSSSGPSLNGEEDDEYQPSDEADDGDFENSDDERIIDLTEDLSLQQSDEERFNGAPHGRSAKHSQSPALRRSPSDATEPGRMTSQQRSELTNAGLHVDRLPRSLAELCGPPESAVTNPNAIDEDLEQELRRLARETPQGWGSVLTVRGRCFAMLPMALRKKRARSPDHIERQDDFFEADAVYFLPISVEERDRIWRGRLKELEEGEDDDEVIEILDDP